MSTTKMSKAEAVRNIARTRRPTDAENAEASAAYKLAAQGALVLNGTTVA